MAFNKSSMAQAMMGNGGFMARAPRGKGKGHKYDLTGADSGAGFQEPSDPMDSAESADPTDEETGEQDTGGQEFKRLVVTPSDNGGFLIECEYNDDGSGNMEPPSTHTFEDAQGAVDFLSQKLTGEDQSDGSDESGDPASVSDESDDSLGD